MISTPKTVMSLALLAISMVAILEGILRDDGAKRYLMSSRSKVIDGASSDLHRGSSSGEPVVPFPKLGSGICTFHTFPDCAWCFVHVCITCMVFRARVHHATRYACTRDKCSLHLPE